jgi:hypothetical protein
MTDEQREPQSEEAAARERARRRARVFGDVLPETTRDDRDDRGDSPSSRSADEWLRRQVPPHHGE